MDRRALLEAMASGGSAGVRSYQDYQAQVHKVDTAAYEGIIGDVGDDPAYREMLSRYTDPYARDASTAIGNYGDQLGYEQTAMAGMRDDLNQDLSRQQYEVSMRNQTEDVIRNANRAAAQAQQQSAGAYDDMTQAEMRAMATGAADLLQGRTDQHLKEKAVSSGAMGLALQGIGAAVRTAAPLIPENEAMRQGVRQRLSDPDAPLSHGAAATDRGRRSGQDARDNANDIAARLTERGGGMRDDAAEQWQGRALLPMYRQTFGEAALGGMGLDPLSAAGFASEWFKPADQINAMSAEQEAYNTLVYGDPEGEAGLAKAEREERDSYVDAVLADVETTTGIPAAAISSAGNDALLSTEQVAAIVTDDAWTAVDEKAREFAESGDIDGYLTWLEENADKQTQMLAINLYDPLFG